MQSTTQKRFVQKYFEPEEGVGSYGTFTDARGSGLLLCHTSLDILRLMYEAHSRIILIEKITCSQNRMHLGIQKSWTG